MTLGAPGEFAVEMASPQARRIPTFRPGPDTDAMQEQQALPEQKAETKETELPKDSRTRSTIPIGSSPRTSRRSRRTRIRRSRRSKTPRCGGLAEVRCDGAADARRGRARGREGPAAVIGIGKDILRLTPTGIARSARISRSTRSPRRAKDQQSEGKVSFATQPQGAMCCQSMRVIAVVGGCPPTTRPRPSVRKSIRCRNRRREADRSRLHAGCDFPEGQGQGQGLMPEDRH